MEVVCAIDTAYHERVFDSRGKAIHPTPEAGAFSLEICKNNGEKFKWLRV
jgi:hypothetical protein